MTAVMVISLIARAASLPTIEIIGRSRFYAGAGVSAYKTVLYRVDTGGFDSLLF